MRYILLLFSILLFASCNNLNGYCKSDDVHHEKLVAVALTYEHNSKIWLLNPNRNTITKIKEIKSRVPNISLGDTISVEYCKDQIKIKSKKYFTKDKDLANKSIFVHLDNYKYLVY